MAEYLTQLVEEVLPLPDSVDQTELNERGLFVVQGLTLSLAEQLVVRSEEDHVVRYCPNDAPKRFKDVDAIVAWQTKGRLPFPLVSEMGGNALRLQGLGWMGPGVPDKYEPTIPGALTTFAERVYSDAVGKGNARPLAQAMLDTHEVLHGNEGVWLEAWVDNVKATTTYKNVGFEEFTVIDGTLHGEPMKRVYMTLGQLV